MLEWKQRLARWEGTVEELGATAREVAWEIGLRASGTETLAFNERLIRSYVQAGAVDRPERRGREAYFGFLQLVQTLAVRRLLNDGWPLTRIAEYTRFTPIESLLELLPLEREPEPPQRAHATRQTASATPSTLADHSADLMRRRQQQHEIAAALPQTATASGDPDICVRIELVSGCEVYINRRLLRQLTAAQADQFGQALSHALIEQRLNHKGAI